MNKKAEEHMTRIAGEFCTWLRSLPGEDKKVNQMTEEHLRALFDTGHGKSGGDLVVPQESVDGDSDDEDEGAKTTTFALEEKTTSSSKSRGKGDQIRCNWIKQFVQHSPFLESMNKQRRQYYGRWYLQPRQWDTRLQHNLSTRGGDVKIDNTRVKLGVSPSCAKVDVTVAQLHSTKVETIFRL